MTNNEKIMLDDCLAIEETLTEKDAKYVAWLHRWWLEKPMTKKQHDWLSDIHASTSKPN